MFTDNVPRMTLHLTGEGNDQESRHVDDTLHHPERTFPTVIGKNAPGENDPLHRLMDTSRRSDNHTASVGVDAAIEQARDAIAVSTGYELYISCAQDLIPISVQVEEWDGQPDKERETTASSQLTLECPTGQLVLGSPTGEATSIELATGPGIYRLLITHTGRTAATQHRDQLLARLATAPNIDLHAATDSQAGLERYTISLWRNSVLDNDPVNESP